MGAAIVLVLVVAAVSVLIGVVRSAGAPDVSGEQVVAADFRAVEIKAPQRSGSAPRAKTIMIASHSVPNRAAA